MSIDIPNDAPLGLTLEQYLARGLTPLQANVLIGRWNSRPYNADNEYKGINIGYFRKVLSDYEISQLHRTGGVDNLVKAFELKSDQRKDEKNVANINKQIAILMGNKPPSPPVYDPVTATYRAPSTPPVYDPVAAAKAYEAATAARNKADFEAAANAEIARRQQSDRDAAAYAAAQLAAAAAYDIRSKAEAAANKLRVDAEIAKFQAHFKAQQDADAAFKQMLKDAELKRFKEDCDRSNAESKAAQDHADKANAALKAAQEAAAKAAKDAADKAAKDAADKAAKDAADMALQQAQADQAAAAQREKDAAEAKLRVQQELKATQNEIAKASGLADAVFPPSVTAVYTAISDNLARAVNDSKEATQKSEADRGLKPLDKPFISSATFTRGLNKAANIKAQSDLTAAALAAAKTSGLSTKNTSNLMNNVAKAIANRQKAASGKKNAIAPPKPINTAANKPLPKPKGGRIR